MSGRRREQLTRQQSYQGGGNDRVIRLRPYHYIHVLDNNLNVARVVSGPKTFIRKDHEEIVVGSTAMISIPPRSYCVVANPFAADENGSPKTLEDGQVQLRHGEIEIRLFNNKRWTGPFPLYPGESLQKRVTSLQVVKPNTAMHLKAVRDFDDGKTKRVAGDEWLFKGPGTYIPRIEEEVIATILAQTIKPNQALKLVAKKGFVDRKGVTRQCGEEWIVTDQGSFLPDVNEKIVGMVRAKVLTEKKALHLRAAHTFTDVYGKQRKAGTEWLITHNDAQTHMPRVHETVIGEVKITTLTNQQYCVILNPVDQNGVPQFGTKKLILGEKSFFLQPGEQLQNNRIEDAEILGEEEALLLRASERFVEEREGKEANVVREPGSEWMIYGPCKYVPPVQVSITERRKRIPLDKNEGIYVRNKQSGEVRCVSGRAYMLKPNEELFEKRLPRMVEDMLLQTGYRGQGHEYEKPKPRALYKAVTYRVPHNAAVQLYDYKKNISRVAFGPELVMLEPDEQFTIISLSGGIPKRANAITSLCLMLGPDFMNDTVIVETSDHARLKLKLSYNWSFKVDKNNKEQCSRIFSVRDFIGDACKSMASRVRGAIASRSFDDVHKNSAKIIRSAVFGQGKETEGLLFNSNLLSITNVDIQSVEPTEPRTRDALQKSVQLAIEITTASAQALADHVAAKEKQIADGELQRQKIRDQTDSEREKKSLVEMKARTAAIESTGQAQAEAKARAQAALIKGKAAVEQATLRAQASKIRYTARLNQLHLKQKQDIEHKKSLDDLEISKKKEESKIESEKFAQIVEAIGSDTIEQIAKAGPEMQARLLEGLGLQGFLVTDGTSPINLFNTANGLVGGSQ